MPVAGMAVLWPSEKNYARFKEVCADQIHDSFADYERSAGAKLDQLKAGGVHLERVEFDPDELLAFAKSQGGKVDSQMRAAYAAVVMAKRDRRG